MTIAKAKPIFLNVGKKLMDDIHNHFHVGYKIIWDDYLNQFMVDYDIIQILKGFVGYSIFSNVS